MDQDRLTVLLQSYFDQLLTASEWAELSGMLRASARARDEFWEMAHLHALLRQLGESAVGCGLHPDELEALPPPPRPKRPAKIVSFPATWLIPISAAAAVIFVLSLIPLRFRGSDRREVAATSDIAPEVALNGVAVLARSAGAVWQDTESQWQVGQALEAGWLRLKSGAVQIEFSRGARLILEGPAELQLINGNEAYLLAGKLRAHVPQPAHGFTIRTPEFEVVDRGTEFGCDLPKPGTGEVHVFTGLVSLLQPGKAERNVQANHAVSLAGGQVQEIPARRGLFLSDEELSRRETASSTDRLSAWRRSREALSKRAGALVHFDFEGDSGWARTLTNRVPKADVLAASIIGCNLVEGRWRGKGALEFKRADDRLRLTVPGSYPSLTFLAWVRVDSLSRNQQSLLMTEGDTPGDVHWYVYRDGRLGIGVRKNLPENESGWELFHSVSGFTPETLGTWAMVTTVFDGATKKVRHYFNGEPVGEEQFDARVPLKLGTLEIGNWPVSPKDPRWSAAKLRERMRSLDGRMDEFAVFSQPLERAEILRLFEEGRPELPLQVAASASAISR
ncbi:MAG TPA: LamG-like jellyroll fold domain-containing protein [Chthoniobacteraceae bacterium]|jgi:hypothetical protein